MIYWTKSLIAQSWLGKIIHQVMEAIGWSVTIDFSPYFSGLIF
jgi:hypothetical protein